MTKSQFNSEINNGIACIILTYNEQLHIRRAIQSCNQICERIIVVDSFSTDETVKIAKELGADIYQRKFINQAEQFNWALQNCNIKQPWTLKLDADEVLSEKLIQEIREKTSSIKCASVVGFLIPRKHIFQGTWIRFGGRYPLYLMRLWRTGTARAENRWMDEHIVVKHGNIARLKGSFSDYNLNPLTYFIEKHNAYATRQAVQTVLEAKRHTKKYSNKNNLQTKTKRIMKEKVFDRLPPYTAGFLYFFYRYFILLGFLDGNAGLKYHFFQALWYRILVAAKIEEIYQNVDLSSECFLLNLSEYTNLNLQDFELEDE